MTANGKSSRWRATGFIAAAAAAALVMSACTASGGDNGAAQAGKDLTVTVGEVQDPASWDPYAQSGVNEGYSQWANVIEPLVTYDYATEKYVPVLATSWSMSGNTWTFKLRKNVKFQSGNPFTAKDVVYTINHIKTDQQSQQSDKVTNVKTVTAVNDTTVKFTLNTVDVTLLDGLQLIYMTSHVTGPDSVAKHKVDGTGPFALKTWARGQQLLFTRNDHYWGPEPKIKTLIFKPIG